MTPLQTYIEEREKEMFSQVVNLILRDYISLLNTLEIK